VLKESGDDLPFIVLSGTVSEENAVDALRAGAHDFISKGKLARLLPAIDRELREAHVRKAQREAEQALRETEQRHRRIVETTNEGIWMVDGSSSTTFVNARMASLLGLSRDDLLGKSIVDFSNRLGIIPSYAGLLGQAITDSGMLEDLREIQRAAERAAGLTKQLLAFSRKQVLNPVAISPNDLVLEIEKLLGRVIGSGVKVKSRLGADVGEVRVDRGQMDQVLINLVVNARDAMPGGGTVTIDTTNVVLDESLDGMPIRPGAFVAISVTDTGTGMDPQ